MPNKEAIQRGYDWENRVAGVLGLRQTVSSGNKFWDRSDCVGNGLIVSCKSEADIVWARLYRNLMEAIDLSEGTGNIPALAVEWAEKDEIIVMTLKDFQRALTEIKLPETFESKGLEKRDRANTPIMLRS